MYAFGIKDWFLLARVRGWDSEKTGPLIGCKEVKSVHVIASPLV